MRTLKIIVLALILAACGEPKIDASTEESMKSSMEQIKARMTTEERAEFEKAAQVVLMTEVDFKEMMQAALRGEEFDSEQVASDMKNRLDGMTAADILSEAERIKSERKQREISEMRSEITDLESNGAVIVNRK